MSKSDSSLQQELRDLKRRVAKLEGGASGIHKGGREQGSASALGACSLPSVPERSFGSDVSDFRARLIRYIDKKWVNGTKLRYFFFPDAPFRGGPEQLELVRDGFKVWEDVGIGIQFEEVSRIEDAEIRIGFLQGDGSWSYVGRDIIDIPGQFERTMNFGWDLTLDPRGVDTPVHEIGHTLGFPHEHQNPFSGIVWDEDAVLREFGGPPNNWPPETTRRNILNKLPAGAVSGTEWDPNSVMHYGFGPGLIIEPSKYREGITPELGLSEADISQVRLFYPPLDDESHAKLEPWKAELLSIGPAEQKNFIIEPTSSREYTIQTFGNSDTLMVLFEQDGDEQLFLAGDDDSGMNTNARIQIRLFRGRRYLLRVRLYLNWDSGNTAVFMW